MKESHVLVIGLSNCCTELARHLILSGINLQLLALKSTGEASEQQLKVQEDDHIDDFLLQQEDAGKKKGEVVV